MKRFLIISLLILSAAAAFAVEKAEKAEVAVLYNGNTPVNTDGLHFISKQFADLDAPYRLKPFRDTKKLNIGDYKAVLVLNTSLNGGIDRVLADFIATQPDKSRLILISLRKDSDDYTVAQFPPSKATLGVDAITAASTWTGKGLGSIIGGKTSADYEMHVDWVNRVIALLDRLP